jgi:glucosamine--fructose-6-phosphate aminotransferase (isomerizing)
MASAEATTSLMLAEALEAPGAVARMLAANEPVCRALGERLRAAPPGFAASCARGSSDCAATFAKYLFEVRLATVTASIGPSVRSVYAAAPRLGGALFFAVSQSGRSPDLLHLAELARAQGALTLAFTNDVASPLTAICEASLPLHAGPELSVAATKSFICSLAAILQLAAHWAEDKALLKAVEELPQALERAARLDWSAAAHRLAAADGLFVVGRGIGLALAQEAALKLKETCGIHAEALSAAELMHGPLALTGPDFPVLVFSQHDEAYQGVADLIATLEARGVPVIAAGPTPSGSCLQLPCDPTLNPFATPIALIQSFYPLVEEVARRRGRDPDRPPHLRKVTETL